uniref:Uncharacterized protein n=1 Tax=Acrobeloides nanus TaxID=290746 RepID=A0A914BZ15_9BILA
MGQSTADEFEGMLKEATKAARQRRKHRRTSRSSTLFHSDSENSVELPSSGVLCRELHFEDELNDSGLGNSTLNAASFSPAILTKDDEGVLQQADHVAKKICGVSHSSGNSKNHFMEFYGTTGDENGNFNILGFEQSKLGQHDEDFIPQKDIDLINHLRKDQSSETNSISSYDSSSMDQLTSDEFENLLKGATRAARRRRKHRRSCRRRSSLSHSDSEISAILPADNVLCRELYFEDELDDIGLEDSTLHASSFLLNISDKDSEEVFHQDNHENNEALDDAKIVQSSLWARFFNSPWTCVLLPTAISIGVYLMIKLAHEAFPTIL